VDKWNTIKIGDEMPPLTKPPVSEVQLVRYAGATGDFNPLHYMESAGKNAGQGGVIAHGMLIMGFMGQAADGWMPGCRLKKLKTRFIKPTRPGDVITVYGKVTAKAMAGDRAYITCALSAGDQNRQIKAIGEVEIWLS